jgi:RNA polymerase sigma-70 factor (ECF subfamily)
LTINRKSDKVMLWYPVSLRAAYYTQPVNFLFYLFVRLFSIVYPTEESLPSMTDDEILIKRIKEGDLSAFDELMNRYSRSVYYLALKRTNNHEDAEDIAQEVFVRVFNALPTWKPKASFYTWLRAVTVNLCIDHHRKRIRRQTQPLESKGGFAMDISTDPSSDPLESTEAEELRQRILLATEKLSPRQRKAFMLFRYGGLSLEETAEAMGCAVGTIKAHLSRATAKMRDLLQDLADDWKIRGGD